MCVHRLKELTNVVLDLNIIIGNYFIADLEVLIENSTISTTTITDVVKQQSSGLRTGKTPYYI